MLYYKCGANAKQMVHIVFKNERLLRCFRTETSAAECIEHLAKKYIDCSYTVKVRQVNLILLEKGGDTIRIYYECMPVE